ncbi:MAG: LysR family transcriptional regulator, partial [Betaproteobacteria bacterium]|nr:LysR family transcriptional regulator [Betaproteobacteria bacterium]
GLLAVIRSGSFSTASRELQLTKASVWQQVRALEEEFACVLLESVGRRLRPTESGLRLAQLATPLVEGFDSIKEAFAADLANAKASLSIATTPSCLAHELPKAVKATQKQFPDAHLTLHDRNSPATLELLSSGEADLAVAARFEEWPAIASLDFLPLTEHPFVLGAPAEWHPRCQKAF